MCGKKAIEPRTRAARIIGLSRVCFDRVVDAVVVVPVKRGTAACAGSANLTILILYLENGSRQESYA